MTRPFPPTRIWGAVWTDDGPIAEVRDITTRDEFLALTASQDFRWWLLCAMDCLSSKGHSKGGCAPAKPCQKCHDKAASWWFEHGRRTKERRYRPCRAGARREHVVDAADWGPRFQDRDEAITHAKLGGYPLVCMMDGHGTKIEWIEVSP